MKRSTERQASRYERCRIHLPAAIAARYFSFLRGVPTMMCEQLGSKACLSRTTPPTRPDRTMWESIKIRQTVCIIHVYIAVCQSAESDIHPNCWVIVSCCESNISLFLESNTFSTVSCNQCVPLYVMFLFVIEHFGWKHCFSKSYIYEAMVYLRNLISQQETSAGGNTPMACRQILLCIHQGLSPLTSGLWRVRGLTKLLYEVTVVDALLRAEGGELESGWLLLFLLRDKGPFNTSSLFESNKNTVIEMLPLLVDM